jgi:aspartyl-tRNA(Asn)/glutamyl-tRNA(Gln) amidotransferase subunit A
MSALEKLSASEISNKVRSKEVSAAEVARAFLDRAEKANPKVLAFLEIHREEALRSAEAVDAKIKRGEDPGSLAGVPVAVKDNMCITGTKTTCSSKILQNFVAPYDATVIRKLRESGAVFVGKTNLDEFAMGSSTENSAFQTTRNPWDLERTPGGSSGGSAAAVAARLAPVSLGSDTGGSIRQPAGFCGILGMKPTYGRVSRFGLVAFASSLDQIGPFSTTAEDNALLLKAISGYDPKDSTSSEEPVPDYPSEMKKPLKKLRIGLPKEYFVDGMDSAVRRKVMDAAKSFEKLGAQLVEVSLPRMEYGLAVYYILAPSEASANLARYDGVRFGYRSPTAKSLLDLYEKSRDEGFGSEVKRRIMIGTYALSSGYYDAYYSKAQKVRTLIIEDFRKALEQADVLLTPTSPTPPFKIGEKSSDPLQMYLSDIFTISCNLAGIPGLSVPCGFSESGLPIGFQLMGRPFDEATLLSLAHHYESVSDANRRAPAFAGAF